MISVCVPTFSQYGHGVKHLTILFNSLEKQKGVFNVIISDNCETGEIKTLCDFYKNRLPIYYHFNPIIGISANTNNAIEHATFDKIKLMYMDDICCDPYCLAHFSESLNRKEWAVSNSYKINGAGVRIRIKQPTWSDRVLEGFNTIGMPSVVGFRKNEFRFDEKLKTLLDCEFYWLMYKKFGEPEWIRKPIVSQRYHDNSTSSIQGNMRVSEFEYLKKKYNLK